MRNGPYYGYGADVPSMAMVYGPVLPSNPDVVPTPSALAPTPTGSGWTGWGSGVGSLIPGAVVGVGAGYLTKKLTGSIFLALGVGVGVGLCTTFYVGMTNVKSW
jgi:hypothetical protein